MNIYYWSLYFIAIALSSIGGLLLKLGAIQISYERGAINAVFEIATNWKILLGMLMYFIPVLIWILMLKKIELSFLQPLFSLVYIVTPVLALFFLNESIPFIRWVWIAVVTLGVIIISRS